MALSELTRIVNKAVNLATKHGKVTRSALEGATGADAKVVSKALKEGVASGLLQQQGAKRGTFYTVGEA